MSARKEKPNPSGAGHWYHAAHAIPFAALLTDDGGKRNARMALRDSKTPPVVRAEFERYLANPFLAASQDQAKLLTEAAKDFDAAEKRAAPFRAGRTKGRGNKATEAVRAHIRALLDKTPRSSPSRLFKKADRKIIGRMQEKTFSDHVRAVRKK